MHTCAYTLTTQHCLFCKIRPEPDKELEKQNERFQLQERFQPKLLSFLMGQNLTHSSIKENMLITVSSNFSGFKLIHTSFTVIVFLYWYKPWKYIYLWTNSRGLEFWLSDASGPFLRNNTRSWNKCPSSASSLSHFHLPLCSSRVRDRYSQHTLCLTLHQGTAFP